MSKLNPRQQEAVHYADGPLLVLAGAGSGKTSVITRKIAWLIQERGMSARHIAAVTFTNKAAREMKERVQSLVSRDLTRGLIVSTFHNLGLRILKSELKACGLRNGFSILDGADSKEILKEILRQGESERDLDAVDVIHKRISDWKNALVLPEEAVSTAETDEDLRAAMSDILGSFKPGRNGFLTQLLRGKRVEKILFAATKADHLHHSQHASLTAIMEALTRDARDRARFAGAQTSAMSLASLRATTEATMTHNGETLEVVRGSLLDTGKEAAFYPGELPKDPAHLLSPARAGAEKWLDQDYQIMRFAPARLNLRPGDGPPHIRLDRAAEFLIGDRL